MKPTARPTMQARTTVGARVEQPHPGTWRLSIPAQQEKPRSPYQVAQLDDYTGQPRRAFPWRTPASIALSARVSEADLPGTWGFGWWNDPFNVALGMGGRRRSFPALPNAVWFIHAAPPAYLTIHNTHPASGFLAGSFSTPRYPWPLLALSVPALPLLGLPPTARLLRRLGTCFVQEDAARVEIDPTVAHAYRIAWTARDVRFLVDGAEVFRTTVVPREPLGAVLWIDNQYMAFPPNGKVRFGTLPHPGGWLELTGIVLA